MRHYTSQEHYSAFKAGQLSEMPALCGARTNVDGGPSGHGVNCPVCVNKHNQNKNGGWKPDSRGAR